MEAGPGTPSLPGAPPQQAPAPAQPSSPPPPSQHQHQHPHVHAHAAAPEGPALPPTYQLKPLDREKFSAAEARRIMERVLLQELAPAGGAKQPQPSPPPQPQQPYDDAAARELAVTLGERVKRALKAGLHIPRYKLVVQVSVGEMRDQGIRVGSRCLWDPSTDSYASASFKNESIWCSVLVFAVYME